VSQPCDRRCRIATPGAIDHDLNEFWVENPWQIIARGENLSAYERKRTFLNVGGQNFLDISFLTGADNDGDGRSVVAADFRNNGRLDLIVRQVGGGPVYLYENRFPQKHYLEVSLRGHASNRHGIGARITAVVRGQQQVREMYPYNTYRSEAPTIAHFGLGEAEGLDSLSIRWPSGKVQELGPLRGDRHIVVDEEAAGEAAVETVLPGRTIAP
jgi:hypothetical protein